MKHKRLLLGILAAVVVLTVSGFAVQRSVTIRTSWKVLPYQTLRLGDSLDDMAAVAIELPVPTPLDIARGYIESEHAVRLHVVSNTAWKLQVRSHNGNSDSASALQVRNHGDEYFPLSTQPQILAQGLNGVFEISVDYRASVNSDGDLSVPTPGEIIYTIMSN